MAKKKEESVFSDMPLGLGMALIQNVQAMEYYSGLNAADKQKIRGYIQGAQNGKDAKNRVNTVVMGLKEHRVDVI
ncbi:MAG: hypothetical protein IJF54_02320 [Clostridia bacterium]|nr:hypothetical protein [Clostridia bacterium]